MAAQRRIDLVLDSVKRLLRVGASANLLNLLQKQHPADLAQLFSELPDKDRHAAFSVLVERNSRMLPEDSRERPEPVDAQAHSIARLERYLPRIDSVVIEVEYEETRSAAHRHAIQVTVIDLQAWQANGFANTSAAMSAMPVIIAISTISSDERSSSHR